MILYESSYYGTVPLASNYLMHYQVKGAKHGVRRWQNYDGSLTPAGYIHYGVGQGHNKAKTDDGLSDSEREIERIKASVKPLTKYNPKLKGEALYSNQLAIVFEAGEAAVSGKSKSEVTKLLRKSGLGPVSTNDVIEALERKGNFKDMSLKERASKLEEMKKKYSRANGEDYTVGKGLETQRFTTSENEEVGDLRKYVSVTDKDKQIYKDFYPAALREWGRRTAYQGISDKLKAPDRVYETKLSTLKELKVAGAKAYSNAFMELYNDPETRKQQGWQKTEKGKLYTKIFGKQVAELQAREVARARASFDMNLQIGTLDINKRFLKKLQDRGYDAVEDQFSRRNDGTEGNLIVLNPRSTLKRTSSKEVKFDESGKYSGTMSKKEGNKRYAEEVKRAEALHKDLNKAMASAHIDKDGKDVGVVTSDDVQRTMQHIQKKYNLTAEEADIAMLQVAAERRRKKGA